MAAWLIPALRAVLPHVGTIISAAKPIFTKPRPGPAESSAGGSLQQQIEELQAAAAQNDAHIRELAEQLQSTVALLQDAALTAEAKARRLMRICIGAMSIAVIAAIVSVVTVLNR